MIKWNEGKYGGLEYPKPEINEQIEKFWEYVLNGYEGQERSGAYFISVIFKNDLRIDFGREGGNHTQEKVNEIRKECEDYLNKMGRANLKKWPNIIIKSSDSEG